MSTKHSIAAEKFQENRELASWHDQTLWMVRAKRDARGNRRNKNRYLRVGF